MVIANPKYAFDYRKNVAYDAEHKRKFHWRARGQMRALAMALGLPADAFELRSNLGGIAVSGEITLHTDKVYVQASSPFGNPDTGILVRTCQGRKDYTGGRNHFLPLRLLDDVEALARQVRRIGGL